MFRHSLTPEKNNSDSALVMLNMMYITMVILSIILFNQILEFNIFSIDIRLSGSVVPYVFLYPISFTVLRVYGFKHVNRMIGAMLVISLVFVAMCKVVVLLSSNTTSVHHILASSAKMYLAGLLGMPAGIYTSFLVINLFSKIGMKFNVISITIATIIGEIVNTLIVFPIGFNGEFSLSTIFSKLIVDAMVYKAIFAAVLSIIAVVVINILTQRKINSA
jgi:uncharacterized PurR-regulated membrane protein YhhQ (DUF165 family)